jgi:hypothetical protein
VVRNVTISLLIGNKTSGCALNLVDRSCIMNILKYVFDRLPPNAQIKYDVLRNSIFRKRREVRAESFGDPNQETQKNWD